MMKLKMLALHFTYLAFQANTCAYYQDYFATAAVASYDAVTTY